MYVGSILNGKDFTIEIKSFKPPTISHNPKMGPVYIYIKPEINIIDEGKVITTYLYEIHLNIFSSKYKNMIILTIFLDNENLIPLGFRQDYSIDLAKDMPPLYTAAINSGCLSVVKPLATGNSSAASTPAPASVSASVTTLENPLAASSSTSVKNTAALSTIENPLAVAASSAGSAAANWVPQKPCKKGSSCSVQGGSRKKQQKSRRHKSKKRSGRSRKTLRKTLRKTH